MSPRTAITTCFGKYFTFSGRAGRPEYLWFLGFCAVVFAALHFAEAQLWGWTLKNGASSTLLTTCFHLIIALPFLAVMLRRAQDIGFHPAIVFLPAMAFYIRDDLLSPIALGLETAQGLQGSEARAASYQNVIGQLSFQLFFLARMLFFAIVTLFALLPTNFARNIPLFRSPTNEV